MKARCSGWHTDALPSPLAARPQSLLRCRWAPGRTFSLDFVLRVAGGLADALEHMHYRGVAHGDVYAHNVLADEEGRVYLCDYGACGAGWRLRGLRGWDAACGWGLCVLCMLGR